MTVRSHQEFYDESGFTLVELLVVILIIGVLAAIAIPAFMNQRQRANAAALESDMKNVITAVHTYQLNNEAFIGATDPHWTVGGSGWLAVFLEGDNARFGISSDIGPRKPADFPSVSLSEGAGVGVVTSIPANPDENSRRPGEFCVIGHMDNSPYEVQGSTAQERLRSALFFDSRLGTMFDGTELAPGGSCHNYYERMNA